uniref:Uncharacterized protein n=1 Tax=Romanomermis culicivorax TaxID=13658 RepID=A0A915K530_ROMCU
MIISHKNVHGRATAYFTAGPRHPRPISRCLIGHGRRGRTVTYKCGSSHKMISEIEVLCNTMSNCANRLSKEMPGKANILRKTPSHSQRNMGLLKEPSGFNQGRG